jgi:hypothetical protein
MIAKLVESASVQAQLRWCTLRTGRTNVELWHAILLGFVIIAAPVLAIVMIVSSIAAKLNTVIVKLERIEWATAELERRFPDWLGRK